VSPRAAVFLDRDGVLNEVVMRQDRVESPRALDEFRIVPDAAAAVARLKAAGLPVLVVTNQPDVARGLLSRADLDAMLDRLRTEVGIDDALACPHDDADRCECRKPLPGLLAALARRWDVALERSFMVGDTWRDMDAGRTAGCRTVLLRTSYNGDAHGDAVAGSLGAAADWILEANGSGKAHG
jgi:D-glycero-D-manno-heptose 1,7-bisphosphate phosphatase